MSRRATRRAVLCLGALAAAVLAAEAALRPWPPELAVAWLLRPSESVMDGEALFLKPYHRDPATYALGSDAAVVIALGDSFTAAYPVADDAAYTVHLSARLAEAGLDAAVVNVGEGDTGPDQQLRVFEAHVLPHARPAVVVWQMYANDVWDNRTKALYAIRDGRLAPLDIRRNWLFVRQRVFDLTPLPAVLKRESRLYQHLMRATQVWMERDVPSDWPGGADGWALAKLALAVERMEAHARERGFRVYFALVAPQALYLDAAGAPWREAPHIRHLRRFHDRMHELLAPRAGFISIAGLEAGTGEPAATALFAGSDRDHNSLGDRHFNELGYERMAAAIAARLLADGALSKAPAAAAHAREVSVRAGGE